LTFFAALAAFYLFLLAEEAYSARQASKMLDGLEALRIEEPAEDFERAVKGCKIEKDNSNWSCTMIAGPFRRSFPWKQIGTTIQGLNRAGLRYWRLVAFAVIKDDKIQSVSVVFFSNGRYEALGSRWAIADQIPSLYQPIAKDANQQRTFLGWYHITSVPSGEGFEVYATPASTDVELRARHINRRCFLSSRGCDGLCELLPDAIPVLRERNMSWGGWTGVPPSKCEWK
jgi:hypothetical protein